jgi:hypothetical protein
VVAISEYAAHAAGIDPDRIQFVGPLRIVRRSVTDRAAFPPEPHAAFLPRVLVRIARPCNRNPQRRHEAPAPQRRPRTPRTGPRHPVQRAADHRAPPGTQTPVIACCLNGIGIET